MSTLVISLIASLASAFALYLNYPGWLLFSGWVAFFLPNASEKKLLANYISYAMGEVFALIGNYAFAHNTLLSQTAAYLLIIFVSTYVAIDLSIRNKAISIQNIYLGMISCYALLNIAPHEYFMKALFCPILGYFFAWCSVQITSRLR